MQVHLPAAASAREDRLLLERVPAHGASATSESQRRCCGRRPPAGGRAGPLATKTGDAMRVRLTANLTRYDPRLTGGQEGDYTSGSGSQLGDDFISGKTGKVLS